MLLMHDNSNNEYAQYLVLVAKTKSHSVISECGCEYGGGQWAPKVLHMPRKGFRCRITPRLDGGVLGGLPGQS